MAPRPVSGPLPTTATPQQVLHAAHVAAATAPCAKAPLQGARAIMPHAPPPPQTTFSSRHQAQEVQEEVGATTAATPRAPQEADP